MIKVVKADVWSHSTTLAPDLCHVLHHPHNRDYQTDAGPTELKLVMDRGGDHHSGNVRDGRSHVCCVDCRSRPLAG